MGKFWTYALIWSGISIIFYYMGLIENNLLLSLLLNPSSLTQTDIYELIGLSIISGALSIFVGIVTKNVEFALMSSVAPALIFLFFNFVSVYNKIAAENSVIANIVLAPLMLVFVIVTSIEFWRGRD